MKSPSTLAIFLPPQRRCQRRDQSRYQRGYALLLMMFFVAIMLATVLAVVTSVLTEGRRQNEEEMIWRGQQYVRGVRMYYRKLGKFPTSLDDLTKPKTGSIRFMRAAYKDPMNKEDGSWRLIYVGPAGQLIGSLKPQPNLQIPGAPGFGTAVSTVAGAGTGALSSTATAAPGAAGTATGDNGQPVDPATDPMANPPASAGSDAPTIIGGNIIGVGSKINKRSIKVYDKAKNYLLFEFVWNPAKDQAAAMQQLNAPGSGGIGTPVGSPQGTSGQSPFSGQPGAGTPPTSQPPTQSPTQPPIQPPTQAPPPQ